jgi:hypothetical protein
MSLPRLILNEDLFIAKGLHRRVYRHPDHSSQCVKIDDHDLHYSPTAKEVQYYRKLRWIRPRYDYDEVARCYGWVETNLGRGATYELVLDECTGQVAPTLQVVLEEIRSDGMNARWDLAQVRQAVISFRDGLIRNVIPVRDLHRRNLCVQRLVSGSLRVVAVDSVGHRDAIPLVDVWPWFGRKKVRRYLKIFGLDDEPVLDPRFPKGY